MIVNDEPSPVTPAPPSHGEAGFRATPLGEHGSREDRLAAVLVATGLVVSAVFGGLSPEGVVHFDDLTHYLFARWAWTWPTYLLDDWGKPGFTVLYFLPAGVGWPMCRVLSAILTAWSAWFAYRIAQGLRLRHAWAAVLLAYGQPLFFQLSQTTLTETALAFYLSLAVYLAQRDRWSWSAAVVSLAFVTRHEAIIFLPVWLVLAWRADARLRRLWPILWAPVLVNVGALNVGAGPAFEKYFVARPSSQYGHGSWLTFLSRSMEAWGPAIATLALSGLWAAWRNPQGRLLAASIASYFTAETVIRAMGLFSSGGYARFLVALSPLVAVAALAAWLRLWHKNERRRCVAVALIAATMVLLWAAMERQVVLHAQTRDILAEIPDLDLAKKAVRTATAALAVLALVSILAGRRPGARRWIRPLIPVALAMMMVLTVGKLCGVLPRPPEAAVIDETLQWLDNSGYGDRDVISAVVWMDYARGVVLSPRRPSVRERLEQAPIGTIFAWDRQFAASEQHGLPAGEFVRNPSFRYIHHSRPARPWERPYLTLYEKVAPWNRQDPPTPKTAPSKAESPSVRSRNNACAVQPGGTHSGLDSGRPHAVRSRWGIPSSPTVISSATRSAGDSPSSVGNSRVSRPEPPDPSASAWTCVSSSVASTSRMASSRPLNSLEVRARSLRSASSIFDWCCCVTPAWRTEAILLGGMADIVRSETRDPVASTETATVR